MKETTRAETFTLVFFGACALLTLAVSIPATYAALSLFHDVGGAWGVALSVFALLVFEVGAVGAKLATLAIPEWRGRLTALTVALLAVTTSANYAHGYDLSQAAQASPTLAAVLRDPAGGVVATALAAALFPALLLVFLSAFTARCEAAMQQAHRTEAAAPQHITQAVQVNIAAPPQLPRTLAAYIQARAAELPQHTPPALAAELGTSPDTVRRALALRDTREVEV